ncbi:hypothetical protein D5086_030963 [Populus alba]|uniref:Uncharacterized protein n=1 Tax=Populus alba TaxID=43335 RepID=A0ACC4AQY0_POPAL
MSRVHLISTEYTENICSIPPVNSTFDSDRFSYASNTKNIMLYYGCPTIPSQFLPTLGLSYQFSCNISRTDMVGYYLTRNLSMSATGSFAANISSYLEVMVFGCSGLQMIPCVTNANFLVGGVDTIPILVNSLAIVKTSLMQLLARKSLIDGNISLLKIPDPLEPELTLSAFCTWFSVNSSLEMAMSFITLMILNFLLYKLYWIVETKCKMRCDSVGLLFILLESLQRSSRESSTTFGDGHVVLVPTYKNVVAHLPYPYTIHFFDCSFLSLYLSNSPKSNHLSFLLILSSVSAVDVAVMLKLANSLNPLPSGWSNVSSKASAPTGLVCNVIPLAKTPQ